MKVKVTPPISRFIFIVMCNLSRYDKKHLMTSLSETDTHFVKCIGYLHASTKLRQGDPVPLQYVLEEAIKNKYGIVKDYTDLVQSCLKPREEEFMPMITTIFEESKGSNSDDELELDLLKEDLMCIVCNGMDVGARNRLLECFDCHSLYHQECHKPGVTEDSFENWVRLAKKIKLLNGSGQIVANSPPSNSPLSKSSSSSHRHSSSSSGSTSYKSTYTKSNDKYKSGSSSKSSSTSSSSSSKVTTSSNANLNSSNRISVPPNINIISADKRFQIMKKKAASKLQEKRKLPR
ncbi:hypothetical protein NQ317_009999 [Molorchus minor]|uniref:PHD-type domain-containing protein n=1 Tax=Molorchus minor TaxID=1323400 RepID=A0ABQ9K8U8_9CUCU|nr:hypothetical protein NQ317_009999 [Molorchus minor]